MTAKLQDVDIVGAASHQIIVRMHPQSARGTYGKNPLMEAAMENMKAGLRSIARRPADTVLEMLIKEDASKFDRMKHVDEDPGSSTLFNTTIESSI